MLPAVSMMIWSDLFLCYEWNDENRKNRGKKEPFELFIQAEMAIHTRSLIFLFFPIIQQLSRITYHRRVAYGISRPVIRFTLKTHECYRANPIYIDSIFCGIVRKLPFYKNFKSWILNFQFLESNIFLKNELHLLDVVSSPCHEFSLEKKWNL